MGREAQAGLLEEVDVELEVPEELDELDELDEAEDSDELAELDELLALDPDEESELVELRLSVR